ncbi:MAG: glycoside hydrolase, partial [Acidobacteriaceae bacterium]|nr:glycoside hydrolase [Acidobacteriaceae bacterium]
MPRVTGDDKFESIVMHSRGIGGLFLIACSLVPAIVMAAPNEPDQATLLRQFANPPDNARIMMRWWWFGTAVEKAELARELRVMKDANIGGVEIQPVYPLELDDPQKGFRNLPYLSDGFIDAVRFASTTAHDLGMRVDITLGSGWPYGGPTTPVTEAAGQLRCERVAVSRQTQSVALPAMENGEKLMAAFLAHGDGQTLRREDLKQLTDVENGRMRVPRGSPGTVLFFISSRTGQQVKRPAIGAEGFVLDHYQRAAIERHLSDVGNRLLSAFGDRPPYAVFSDSLEVFGSDWTTDFLAEFQKRRGYDLTPYLPALVGDMGEQTAAIRHDWGKTLTELAEEHYLTPIREWAHAKHTLFRSQSYGEPPVILSSNALADLPEGEEGPHWRAFSPARWASSACHLYGRPVTSTETWTWLHAPAFRATPLDMKAEADLHFIEGINQLIGHGWPYSPPSAGEPGWRFYAAAAFNEHNPWFEVMPDIAKYLQRLSFLMRQGQPANDVAIYLPTDDAWAGFRPEQRLPGHRTQAGNVSVNRSMDTLLGPNLIPQILNAGYNFDFIDDRAISNVGVPYKILILPRVERMPLATIQAIQKYADRGGIVVATRRLPSLAPGLRDAGTDTPQIKQIAQALFERGSKNTRLVQDESTLGSTLNAMCQPDFAVDASVASAVGFIHRKFSWGHVYFVVNTSNKPVNTAARVRVGGLEPEWWDPFTGKEHFAFRKDKGAVLLRLGPYESGVLVFGNSHGNTPLGPGSDLSPVDLSQNWKVTYSRTGQTIDMAQLHSWSDDPQTRFYSGTATYERTTEVEDWMTHSNS